MLRSFLLSSLLLLCIAPFIECDAHAQETDPQRFRYYDHITFYDVYAGTVSLEEHPLPEGVLRLNNSRVTRLLPAEELDRMGDSLRLELTLTALCDNYDRIGSVDLVMMSKDSLDYNDGRHPKPNGGSYSGRLGNTAPDIQRIEVARFITPFMDMNKGVDVPYSWDISFLAPLLHDRQLRDSMNLWLELHVEGVPYAANSQIQGCSGRNDVFAGTLDIVSYGVSPTAPIRQITKPLVYERYVSNSNTDEAGTTVAHYQLHLDEPVDDALFLMINSNHGANSGGEEYNRRIHYVWVNEWMAEVYRPGRQSCEPYRQYNTQSNGIYGSRVMSDEEWQSFSNWCPGAAIESHFIHLGAIPAGDYDFRLMVPDALFVEGQGYFPFSLTFFGCCDGSFVGLDRPLQDNKSSVRWREGVLQIDSDLPVTHWTLLNAAGQRLNVQPGALSELNMSRHAPGIYILVLQLQDQSIDVHKFFRP